MVLVVGARLLEARRLVVVGARLLRADRPRVAVVGDRRKAPADLPPAEVGVRLRAAAVGVRLRAAVGDSSRSDNRPAARCTTARFNLRVVAAAG